jgi:hypothetical protein
MYVGNPIPATVQINRGYLLASVAMIAAIATALTWAVITYGNGGDSGRNSRPAATPSTAGYVESITAMTPAQLRAAFGTVSQADLRSAHYVQGIASMTPRELLAAYGTDMRAAAVLSTVPTRSRLYVESIMAMTPAEVRATWGTGR